MVEQVLMNLVIDASDIMPAGGHPAVSLKAAELYGERPAVRSGIAPIWPRFALPFVAAVQIIKGEAFLPASSPPRTAFECVRISFSQRGARSQWARIRTLFALATCSFVPGRFR